MNKPKVVSKVNIDYYLTKGKQYEVLHTYQSENGLQYKVKSNIGIIDYFLSTCFEEL